MTTLAVIPSRHSSSRFPGKPLAIIAGKPMIQWVWEATIIAKGIDTVVVATDDERIASTVADFGGLAVITDPDISSGTDRVAAVAASMGWNFDLILNIQGDEPTMHPETISMVIDLMIKNSIFSIGTASCPFANFEEIFDPNIVKVITSDSNKALYFSRSPIPYLKKDQSSNNINVNYSTNIKELKNFQRHIGIYAYRPESLMKFTNLPIHCLEKFEMLEQLRALSADMTIGVAKTPHLSLGVDVYADIKVVEKTIMQRFFKNSQNAL